MFKLDVYCIYFVLVILICNHLELGSKFNKYVMIILQDKQAMACDYHIMLFNLS